MSEQKDADIYNTDNEFMKISRSDGNITIGKDTVGLDHKSGWSLKSHITDTDFHNNLPPDYSDLTNNVSNTYLTFIPQAGALNDFPVTQTAEGILRKDPSLIFDIKPINSRWYSDSIPGYGRPGNKIHGASLEFRAGVVSDVGDNGTGLSQNGASAFGGDIRFITGVAHADLSHGVQSYYSGAIRFYIRGNKTGTNTTADKDTFNEVMTINKKGYVGIGVPDSIYPLEIADRGRTTAYVSQFHWYNNGGGYGGAQLQTATLSFPDGISAKFWGGLWIAGALTDTSPHKSGVIYSSDERIKKDITLIDDDLALKKVNALESKEYNYKGTFRQMDHKTIGFIAQDVLKVIPEAVSFQRQIIPDEMRIITEPKWNNNTLTIPELDMSAGNLTGKCKFYVSNDPSGNDEVMKEIECVKDASGNNTNRFNFGQKYNNVFFYGKEVNDFHTIDKNQIFALHHSAIQELSRRNDAKTEKIQALETKYSLLEAENKQLKSDIAIIKKKLGL